MIDLKKVTIEQLTKACAADVARDRQCSEAIAEGNDDPWPAEWRMVKDLFVKNGGDNAAVEWITRAISTCKSNVEAGKAAHIAPFICRAVLIGYELARLQLEDELERMVH